MRAAAILFVVGVMVGALATAAPAADTNQALLWNGVHWQQGTLEGQPGYLFGSGNLADAAGAAAGGRERAWAGPCRPERRSPWTTSITPPR